MRRAGKILGDPTADESAMDQAIGTMMRVTSPPLPPKDFARRVMLAIQQAPPPEGRRSLAKPPTNVSRVAVLVAVAAVTAYGVIVTLGPVATRIFVRTIALSIQVSLRMLVSLNGVFELWSAVSTVRSAVAEAFTSPGMSIAVIAAALVAMLSLTALTRLLSSEQEPSQ